MAVSSGNAFVIVILRLKLAGFKLNINLYYFHRFGFMGAVLKGSRKVAITTMSPIHSVNEYRVLRPHDRYSRQLFIVQ